MKPSPTEIADLLRNPPRRTPPAGLKEKLINDIHMPAIDTIQERATSSLASTSWLKRWWPVLAPIGVSLACAATLVLQQDRISRIEKQTQMVLPGTPVVHLTAPEDVPGGLAASANSAATYQDEITRLKEKVAGLNAEISQLRRMKTENAQLRAQLAAPPGLGLTPGEAQALADAQDRAESISCVNNLKQFGLAVRVWALDNDEMTPPDVVCMSNELSTPKVLVCPGDKGRAVAPNWPSFTAANLSYEFLAPAEKDADSEPNRVLSRCPIHGNVGLCDGSVQRGIARTHPEWFVERNGKTYLERDPVTPAKQP